MKITKRILAIVLSAVMVLAVAGCGESSSSSGGSTAAASTAAASTATETKSEAAAPAATEAAKAEETKAPAAQGTTKEEAAAAVEEITADGQKAASGSHGGTGYVQDSIQKDVVNIAAPDVPTNISPWAGTSTGRHMVNNSMYQPLFEFDKLSGERVLVLAKEITQTDEFTYHVVLYDYIHDSEGNPFTADDAVFSIQNCAELGNVSGMQYIESVEKTDDYELDIVMNTNADYQFDSSISMIYCVTQKAFEDSGDEMNTQPVATGAYKMTNFESGSTVTLEKVDDYWGKDLNDRENNPAWYYHAQNVDKIVFTGVKETSQRTTALQTGDADVALQLTANEANKLQGADGYTVWETTDSRSYNLFFNCGEKSMMSNEKLRQAVCYAVDQAGVMQSTGGYGLLSLTFGSAIFADNNPAWASEDYYGYDVEKAKELIAESGFDTSQEIRFMYATNSDEKVTIAQVIQGFLRQVGLNVRLDAYDSASFAADKYNEDVYDIRLDDASFSCLADLWTQFLSAGKKDKGRAQIKDEELETLLAALATAEGRTTENVDAAHYYIKDKAYCYGLYCRELFDGTTDDILEFVYMPKLYAMPGAFCYS